MSERERAPAPRKPYRISKPREKWTEKEHGKFVQAINEHGRNWKRIVQEVGTRSVAQVRSHAQKYFLKLEKSGDAAEVPPARAKRPSAKPYPVKSTSAAQHGSRSSQSSGPDRKRPKRAATERPNFRDSKELNFMAQESPPISTDGGTEDSVALLLTDAEGNGSNGDASGSNGQSNSAQDNSGLSTADLDYANCLSVPSARGRFVPSTDMILHSQPSTTDRSDPVNDASSGQQEDPIHPPTSYGELYDVVGKLYGNTNTANRQMLQQLGPSQREELVLMMDQLTGEVRDSVGCMPVDQLDAQNLPSFSENLATPSFSDTMGYPISMPSSSLPQLSLSLPDPLSQRQSDLNPTILCRPSLGPPIEPLPDVPVTQANTSGTGLLPSCTHAGSDELIEAPWRLGNTDSLWHPSESSLIHTDGDYQLQPLIDTKIFDY